jgi:hypothetical protein
MDRKAASEYPARGARKRLPGIVSEGSSIFLRKEFS